MCFMFYFTFTSLKEVSINKSNPWPSYNIQEAVASASASGKGQIGLHGNKNFKRGVIVIMNSTPHLVKNVSHDRDYTYLDVEYLCDKGNFMECQKRSPNILQQPSHILSKVT